MNETMTREERRSRLDTFVGQAQAQDENAMVPIAQASPAALQVHGAQKLAQLRDHRRIMQQIRAEAAVAGEDFFYSFPVKNKRTGRVEKIEGPSVKLANAVARAYGNCEVDCRAQDMGGVVLFHARFVDLETGFALTRPFQQRKSAAKIGGSDDERREDIAFQIGASKAIRNVIVNSLQTFSDFALAEAKAALTDRIEQDPARYHKAAVERISNLVALDRVEAVIGRPATDWSPSDIARVISLGSSIAQGMVSADEVFPPLDKDQPNASGRLDRFTDAVVEEEPGEASFAASTQSAASKPPAPSSPEAADDASSSAAVSEEEAAPSGLEPEEIAEIIDKTLGLASHGAMPVEDRLENLDAQRQGLRDRYSGIDAFIDNVVNMAAKVAKGELAVSAAKKYLHALSPEI